MIHIHLRQKHFWRILAGDLNRHEMNPTVSRRQLTPRHPTDLGRRKQTHRHLRDPKMTIILQYQTHIEHQDCSVDDDITISFHPFFDTAKIVYTSSVDHRPSHTRKAIPFVAFLILLLPPFQDSCLGLKFGPVSFYFPFCLLLFLCVGVSVLGTNCFSFLFTAACYGRFCALLRLHFSMALHLQPATCTL